MLAELFVVAQEAAHPAAPGLRHRYVDPCDPAPAPGERGARGAATVGRVPLDGEAVAPAADVAQPQRRPRRDPVAAARAAAGSVGGATPGGAGPAGAALPAGAVIA